MKAIIKYSAVFFLVSSVAISCTKENIKDQVVSTQSEDRDVEKTFHIGDSKGGGIIFYLDSTKKHGLIAAKYDQSTSIGWWNGTYFATGATGKKIGSGANNTSKIIKKLGSTGNYAALLCANYRGGGLTDWFLPSRDELVQLYKHKDKVGGLDAAYYWTSTEFEADINNAYDQDFASGFRFSDDKSLPIHVRAVRSF